MQGDNTVTLIIFGAHRQRIAVCAVCDVAKGDGVGRLFRQVEGEGGACAKRRNVVAVAGGDEVNLFVVTVVQLNFTGFSGLKVAGDVGVVFRIGVFVNGVLDDRAAVRHCHCKRLPGGKPGTVKVRCRNRRGGGEQGVFPALNHIIVGAAPTDRERTAPGDIGNGEGDAVRVTEGVGNARNRGFNFGVTILIRDGRQIEVYGDTKVLLLCHAGYLGVFFNGLNGVGAGTIVGFPLRALRDIGAAPFKQEAGGRLHRNFGVALDEGCVARNPGLFPCRSVCGACVIPGRKPVLEA
ncbi:hypothetical protein SDC9_108389 [bioreactor metagenome]|uniref:Uncharacterized protein n=1 Tax=bioreactor metagenome TaxID=1076179 RepID=A0A645B7T0_9ZZZZ